MNRKNEWSFLLHWDYERENGPFYEPYRKIMILHRALTSRPLNAPNKLFSLISELKAAIPKWKGIVANRQQTGLRRSHWQVIDSLVPGLLLQALAFVLALPHVLFSASYEPVSLAASISSPTEVVVRSNPLRFSAYHVQTSLDLVHWDNTSVIFGPQQNEHVFVPPGTSNLYFRLESDASLALSCTSADATTIQLNWPPIPVAVEYKIYRDGTYVGSTAGRSGYFTDTGLVPATSYEYFLAAFDSDNHLLGFSTTNAFSTTSSSRSRTHYHILAIGFYPSGPDADFAHVETFFRHKIDFIRLASVNSAILEPYKGDIVCIGATPPVFPSTRSVDYAKLAETPYPELDGFSIVDLVERGDVDVVNVVASSAEADCLENALVGNKGLNPIGSGERWTAFPARCSRSFFVNANSGDARAYDAYCHNIEGIMSCICDSDLGAWPRTYPYVVYSKDISDFSTMYPTKLHLFERFRLADQWNGAGAYASLGNGNCGSSHFPPTARRDTDENYHGDYAYYDLKTWQRYIDCAADDWLHFPTLTGTKRKLNGYDYGAFNSYAEGDLAYAGSFGASPELHSSFWLNTASYHQWWFFHLPHNPGVSNGKLNNWWPYIYDLNRFNGRSITYSVTDDAQIPTAFAPVNGEYGTELPTAEWWGYWCSFSDFGPYGQLSVVSNTANPALVSKGQFALQVLVDQEAFHYHGRNDAFYPISRNARWNLSDLREVSVSLKLGLNPGFIAGANPVIRLCANGGNRIEFAPLKNGRYANLFGESGFQETNGWFTFAAPINGSTNWEVNVIGYIDPSLNPQQIADARQQLKQNILSEVNYVEISVHSDGGRGDQVSYYIDDLEFRSGR